MLIGRRRRSKAATVITAVPVNTAVPTVTVTDSNNLDFRNFINSAQIVTLGL